MTRQFIFVVGFILLNLFCDHNIINALDDVDTRLEEGFDPMATRAFTSPRYRSSQLSSSIQKRTTWSTRKLSKKKSESTNYYVTSDAKSSHFSKSTGGGMKISSQKSTKKSTKKSTSSKNKEGGKKGKKKKGGKREKNSKRDKIMTPPSPSEPTTTPTGTDFETSSPIESPMTPSPVSPAPEVNPTLAPITTSRPTPSPVTDPTLSPTVNPTVLPTVSTTTVSPVSSATSSPTPPTSSSTTTSSPTSSEDSMEDQPCRTPMDECCVDSDCGDDDTMICAGRNCVTEGSLRITLTWFGQDDKDLSVETPGGQLIDKANPNDSVSGGILEEDTDPNSNGYHAENIYFPNDHETGQYIIELSGTSDSELWKIAVAVAGEEISAFAGTDATTSLGIEVYSVPSTCGVSTDECCMDSDCSIDEDVCESRNCVKRGIPRFTLSWYGTDDKDLIVTTPDGVDIFFDNPSDPVSGGQLEEDVVPTGVGFYAENIYFPLDGSAPPGTYAYFVRGGGSDVWKMTVALDDVIVDQTTGVGDAVLQYQYGDILPTPSPTTVTQPPTVACSTPDFQCCIGSDCSEGESCANRNCVQDGALRFTLTWIGQGDIDLRVQPPEGDLIYYQNPFDPVSGGTFEGDVDPNEFGYYAENIYFPEETAPQGTYTYGVSGSSQEWELVVYLGGEIVQMHSGVGLSSDFGFELGPCNPETEQCCETSDCIQSEEGDACANRNCVQDGVIRVTLSWDGTDDKDLAVATPAGTTINFSTPIDQVTGGILEGDTRPFEFGNYVENIFFPDPNLTPEGMYTYEIRAGGIDPWTVDVFFNGELFRTASGIGDDASSFEFGGG